jgi:hypothetical protein
MRLQALITPELSISNPTLPLMIALKLVGDCPKNESY